MSERRPPRRNDGRNVTAVRPAVSVGRLRVLALVFALVFGAFGYRLVDLQVTPDQTLADAAASRVRRVELPASRGALVDRHGRPLAVSRPSATVVADPRLVSDDAIPGVVAALAEHLTADPAVLANRLAGPAHYVYLQRQVDVEVGEAIMALGLPGVWLEEEPRREHPNGACSARAVLGRVNIDHVGISGLELRHDDALTGIDGVSLVEVSADGALTIVGGETIITPPQPGDDIALSFDRDVQFKSEQLVADAVEAHQADWGVAIVSVPSTGELVAVAGATRDDETGEVGCTTENLPFTRAYEPGSTMKSVSIAAVIDAGLTSPQEAIRLEPSLPYPLDDGETFTVTDYFPHSEPHYTTTEILGKSSNIGAAMLAERLGGGAMYDRLRDFGFGTGTAIDLPGETPGILHPFTAAVALPTASYGHGVAVSPIQLLAAYNVFANGGRYVDPTVARSPNPPAGRPVIRPETADAMLDMLEVVVTGEGNTGTRAALPGYRVAGKTGTAWQPCADGGYWHCEEGRDHHYTASFVGIVSNEIGPAFSVLVIIDNPRGESYGGGSVAAPLFADVAAYAARQLRVASDASVVALDGPVRAPVSTVTTTPEVGDSRADDPEGGTGVDG